MSDLSQLRIESLRGLVSNEEWQVRVDLAACYRLVHHYGMDDLVYNHISARVPGEEGHFLINAYGMMYDEITASSLLKIDFDGNVVLDSGTGYGINHAGFVIHSAVHKGRPDVGCVIHTHSIAGMAVSALDCGLLPITQTAMYFGGVGMHEYESVAIDLAEQERLVRDLGRRFPAYGFEQHKGYGTPEHWQALSVNGPCPEHRLTYHGVVAGSGAPDVAGSGEPVVADMPEELRAAPRARSRRIVRTNGAR